MLKRVIALSYSYIIFIGVLLWKLNFYEGSEFFRFGCSKELPLTFFSKKITSMKEFYGLQVMMFFHQLINNLVNTVVYPWIINVIQNRNCFYVGMKDVTVLIITNLFDLYSEIDLVLILIGFTSQISFIITICFANLITTTIINKRYLMEKHTSITNVSALNEVLSLRNDDIPFEEDIV